MGYVFNNTTGRITAIILQGTPTPPSGFTFSTDAIDIERIIDSFRNITTNLIQKRDALKISGLNAVKLGTVGQIAVQKFDGETLQDKTAQTDDDPVTYEIENDAVFADKRTSTLVQGADSLRIAAPQVEAESRFLVFSPDLQLLDTRILFD